MKKKRGKRKRSKSVDATRTAKRCNTLQGDTKDMLNTLEEQVIPGDGGDFEQEEDNYDGYEDQTQEWHETLSCDMTTVQNAYSKTPSPEQEIFGEGSKLMRHIDKLVETEVHKKRQTKFSTKKKRARLLKLSVILSNRKKKKMKRMSSQTLEHAQTDKSTLEQGSHVVQNSTQASHAHADQAYENNEDWYQWKGEWYRWDNKTVETMKGEGLNVTKEPKTSRVNTRLRNWMVAMRRNMKADAKEAALEAFTITWDKTDQVYQTSHAFVFAHDSICIYSDNIYVRRTM